MCLFIFVLSRHNNWWAAIICYIVPKVSGLSTTTLPSSLPPCWRNTGNTNALLASFPYHHRYLFLRPFRLETRRHLLLSLFQPSPLMEKSSWNMQKVSYFHLTVYENVSVVTVTGWAFSLATISIKNNHAPAEESQRVTEWVITTKYPGGSLSLSSSHRMSEHLSVTVGSNRRI